MEDVGAAVLLAQPFVRRAVVDDDGVLALDGVGELQKRCRRHVGEDEMRACIDLFDDLLDELGGIVILNLVEAELLVHEAAGGVVVGNRELGTGDAEIGGREVEKRDRQGLVLQLACDQHGYDNGVLIGGRRGRVLSRGC